MRIAFILPRVGKRQGVRYRVPTVVDRLIVKGLPFRATVVTIASLAS